MLTGQVIVNRTEIQWLEFFVRALPALDPRLLTNARYPFILTGDSIAGTAAGALPANRIDILSAAKELPEQFGFLIGCQLRYCRSLRSGMKLVSPGKEGCLFLLKLGQL